MSGHSFSWQKLATFSRPVLWLLVGVLFAVLGILFFRPDYPAPVFRLGIEPWSGYAPGYQARSEKFWENEVVRLVELPMDTEIVRAMRAGALESACMTLDGAFRVQASGIDVRILAVVDYSQGADAVVAVKGRCSALAEIRGKRVGVEYDGVGMLFLARVLRTVGLSLHDITIVNADLTEHAQLIEKNLVDVVVTYSPRKERLIEGGGKVLADSTQVRGEVIDVLLIRADALAKNPLAVRKLWRGWEKAAEQLEGEPSQREKVARVMGMSVEEFTEARRQVRIPNSSESFSLVAGNPPGLLTAARETAKTLVSLGLLEAPIDPDRLFLKPEEVEELRK